MGNVVEDDTCEVNSADRLKLASSGASVHSTQNAFNRKAYKYPANASLNTPSSWCNLFIDVKWLDKVAASSDRSSMADVKKSSPDADDVGGGWS